mmetsp:Transcript_25207/g.28033  ORF Transcript_25207/g.28033 Transcript_25207/m.28033 type:complete len:340 (+) Transcript_25207:43-1062(+)
METGNSTPTPQVQNGANPVGSQTAQAPMVRQAVAATTQAARPPSQRYIPNVQSLRQNGQKRSQTPPNPPKRTAIGPPLTSVAGAPKSPLEALLSSSGIAHSKHISNAEAAALATEIQDDEFYDLDEELLNPSIDPANDPISTTLLDTEIPEPYMDSFSSDASHLLTDVELLRRRKEQVTSLYKFYKIQFRRLEDDLVTKHRRFLIHRAKKLQKIEKGSAPVKVSSTSHHIFNKYHNTYNIKSQILKREASQRVHLHQEEVGDPCAIETCPGKSMPLSKYCYAHILHDKNQKLYQACPWHDSNGDVCGFPVSVHSHPNVCFRHVDLVGASRRSSKTKTKT